VSLRLPGSLGRVRGDRSDSADRAVGEFARQTAAQADGAAPGVAESQAETLRLEVRTDRPRSCERQLPEHAPRMPGARATGKGRIGRIALPAWPAGAQPCGHGEQGKTGMRKND
jgi:hypothetical protein